MALQNPLVVALLRSPLHRLVSRSVDVLRYRGRRTGREITVPTQYARHHDGILILVGRAHTKVWWRNFVGGHDVDVLLDRRWVPMRGRAVTSSESPDEIGPLLDVYLERFPSARRAARSAVGPTVIVECRPRAGSE